MMSFRREIISGIADMKKAPPRMERRLPLCLCVSLVLREKENYMLLKSAMRTIILIRSSMVAFDLGRNRPSSLAVMKPK